jgi:hypothetical protein
VFIISFKLCNKVSGFAFLIVITLNNELVIDFCFELNPDATFSVML